MPKLDTQQINNLIHGKALAMELIAIKPERRAFITIGASSAMKFLNTTDLDNMIFWIRKYEVEEVYIDNDWDVSDDELFESIHLTGIRGVNELECVLSKLVDDFLKLELEWKVDNPL